MSGQVQAQTQPIKLEFVSLDDESVRGILLVDAFKPEKARRAKVRALAPLGITVGDDETPLDAWHKHLCQLNGLEFTKPLPSALADAILGCADACRMVWFLA